MISNTATLVGPYPDDSTNHIYNMLFCDDIALFKERNSQLDKYPWNILTSTEPDLTELQKMVSAKLDSRFKLLAYDKLRKSGATTGNQELLAVVVEVGLEEGLDVLAAFADGTARYINQTGKMIFWETADDTSIIYTNELFAKSKLIVSKIGLWDKERLPAPGNGMARISFLLSDGLYFGQAPINSLFSDPMAADALQSATALMQYLTTQVHH